MLIIANYGGGGGHAYVNDYHTRAQLWIQIIHNSAACLTLQFVLIGSVLLLLCRRFEESSAFYCFFGGVFLLFERALSEPIA